ncbi:hypothetical protein KOR34_38040 [Posidoniimonas corsicana]|uniref:Uncharacterized protein n=2 Tax=Posidoniimonas corsicana TaxID=1938618 RepID=A0A5C5V600_9BACT|nr:hypothetical protein KOR34_38040 [Posidoniimonas corsicana]
MITIHRQWRFSDWSRGYRVMVNGKKVGVIRNGQVKSFAVASGPCEVSVRLDWCGSRKVGFELSPDEDRRLECASAFTLVTNILQPYYALFRRDRFLTLRMVD